MSPPLRRRSAHHLSPRRTTNDLGRPQKKQRPSTLLLFLACITFSEAMFLSLSVWMQNNQQQSSPRFHGATPRRLLRSNFFTREAGAGYPNQEILDTRILSSAQRNQDKTELSNRFSHLLSSRRGRIKSNNQTITEPNDICAAMPGDGDVEINSAGYQILKQIQYLVHQERKLQRETVGTTRDVERIRLLCILPFFPLEVEQVALETYARDCDSVLILKDNAARLDRAATSNSSRIDSSTFETTIAEAPVGPHTLWLDASNSTSWKLGMLRFLDMQQTLNDSSFQYDWIHWAQPHQYTLIDLLRLQIREETRQKAYRISEFQQMQLQRQRQALKQSAAPSRAASFPAWRSHEMRIPIVLESWELQGGTFDELFYFWGAEVQKRLNRQKSQGCEVARTWNRQATDQVLSSKSTSFTLGDPQGPTYHVSPNSGSDFICAHHSYIANFKGLKGCGSIDGRNTPNLVPAGNNLCTAMSWNGPELWKPLKRYTQIPVSDTTNPADDLKRLHHIIQGSCDEQWGESLGALDELGHTGYVHDPSYLKRNPPKFQTNIKLDNKMTGGNCDAPLGHGIEGPQGEKAFAKIRTDHLQAGSMTKVMCLVYSYSNNRGNLKAITETWAPQCDGFMAASNETDKSIGAVNLLHDGLEEYDNMWNKVTAMYKYAYQNYLDEFDWFYFSGDDVYVIVSNLKRLISEDRWNQSEPQFIGATKPVDPQSPTVMCLGGPGYLLNRLALILLVEELLDQPFCRPHYQHSAEDRLVSNCLQHVGVQCINAVDDNGEQRFHNVALDRVPLTFEKSTNSERISTLSARSVSFHLRSLAVGMRRYHGLLQGLCPNIAIDQSP